MCDVKKQINGYLGVRDGMKEEITMVYEKL